MARGARVGAKSDAIKTLRALLKVARERSSSEQLKECSFSQHILATYRARQHETDKSKIKAYRQEATDTLMLLKGVEEQKYLWSLDAGVERKFSTGEIVDKSAHRVGLDMPETYAEEEERRKRELAEKYIAEKKEKQAKEQLKSSA